MTVSLHNRRKLEDAIARLIDGTVTPADGKVTWKNVAAVAGVSKATADRAIDLRAGFRRQLEQPSPGLTVPSPIVRRSRQDGQDDLARLRKELDELKRATKVLHSVILALTQENQRLTRPRRHHEADEPAS